MSKILTSIFSADGKLSLMRVLSLLMFIVATTKLFFVDFSTVQWPGVVLILVLYALAFFPKAVQKKFEKIEVKDLK